VAVTYLGFSRIDTGGATGATTQTTPSSGATIGILMDMFWGDHPDYTYQSVSVDNQSATLSIANRTDQTTPFTTGAILGFVTGFTSGSSVDVVWDLEGTTYSSSEGGRLHILWFSGVDTTTPFAASGVNYNINTNSATVTLNSVNGLFCIFAMEEYTGVGGTGIVTPVITGSPTISYLTNDITYRAQRWDVGTFTANTANTTVSVTSDRGIGYGTVIFAALNEEGSATNDTANPAGAQSVGQAGTITPQVVSAGPINPFASVDITL